MVREAGAEEQRRPGRSRREQTQAGRIRAGVQVAFLLLVTLLVWEYHRWAEAVLHGARLLPARPDGAEAFLPIGAVVSLFHLLRTGEYDPMHPAALAILLGAIVASLLLRKSFCSWICPVGALSEWLGRLGQWCWGRSFRPPRRLGRALLGLKYLFLGFFLLGILRVGDYYYYEFDRYGDVAMYGYWFWGRVGPAMVAFATVMAVWSLLQQSPWCRYLCPYGALLGLFSRFSPARITRDAGGCIGCGKCAMRCPAAIPVDRLLTVQNAECTGCLSCTAACPVPDVLHLQAGRRRVLPRQTALLAVSLFFGVILAAMAAGHWHTGISAEEYRAAVPAVRSGPQAPHRF